MKTFAKLLVFLVLTATALAAPQPPMNGLVGWWRGDGDARDSAGRHDGELPFGMNYAPGRSGQAFDFDGSRRRVSIPDSPDFQLTNSLTIAGWIYPRAYGGFIFFRGDNRGGLDPWTVDLYSDNSLGFQIDNAANEAVKILAPVPLNQWTHFVATLNGKKGDMRIYLNGALVTRTNTAIRPLAELDSTQMAGVGIGNHPGTFHQFPFNGLISDIALYSRALSAAEIRNLYRSGNAGQTEPPIVTPAAGELSLREVRYDGKLSDDEARFAVDIDAEVTAKDGATVKLFEGDVALLPAKLPDGLQIVRDENRYLLNIPRAGKFKFKLDLVAKIQRAEPWNQISFTGPSAAIASLTAQAAGAGMEIQLLTGTALETTATNGVARVKGFLGADQTVALRWQGKVAEVARKVLLTVDTTAAAQITPTVVKYTTKFHYDIVQGRAAQLTLALPAAQALTRLVGEQIRDWQLKPDGLPRQSGAEAGDRQLLTVEFIKPVEKSYDLTLFSEQTVESGGDAHVATSLKLNPPQPLEIERESGAFTLAAEDTQVETESLAGLRQVNATGGDLAAYRFNARPFTLTLKLKRIEPVITVADRVGARLEEARLLITHRLALTVEKAGIYSVEFITPPGMVVADVRGEGIEDWKSVEDEIEQSHEFTPEELKAKTTHTVHVNFSARVLGSRQIEVQLEQALKIFPKEITVAALRVTGATKQTAQIGAASAPGIRLKTAELNGLREIPVRDLQRRAGVSPARAEQSEADNNPTLALRARRAGETPVLHADELLAFTAESPEWKLTLASERLAARVVAEVFNLVTIGDGLVGGSATIRYSLVNQGVQEFKVKLPAWCKNVEFTGPNIRRKEKVDSSKLMVDSPNPSTLNTQLSTNFDVWTIGLQDKAWGGYTLVVTYDYQFDPKGATLPVGGVHTVDVERETGSVAVTTAASLKLTPKTASDTLHRVDEAELAAADRALVTRNVLLAYQYTGGDYDLALDVQRHEELPVLEAVADRTEITSVLTAAGEMLTQASFMVKNNEKQFQKFQLPAGANLWGCYVNNQPAKPERDGDWVLVPLPRDTNRDQAFAVDIVYAEKKAALNSRWPAGIELAAPRTDVPNTYAEWQLYVPSARRLSAFGGSMSVARGTTYSLLDGWEKFLAFYGEVIREAGAGLFVIGMLALLVIALVVSAVRRGWNGIITVFAVFVVLAVLAGMLLPALSSAKSKAQRISGVNNLKQIGLAARLFAGDNNGRLPNSFDEMKNELGTDKITVDPQSGQRFIFLGGGYALDALQPDSVLAYSPPVNGNCSVLLADGSVQMLSAAQFGEMSQRGLLRTVPEDELARRRQVEAVGKEQRLAGANSYSGGTAVSSGTMRMMLSPAKPPASVAAPVFAGRLEEAKVEGDRNKDGFAMTVNGAGNLGYATEAPQNAPAEVETNALPAGGHVFDSGVPAAPAAVTAPAATPPPAPTVSGIRSIRIEIPREGNLFLFTKVLNVGSEPLTVRAKIMSLHLYQTLQMAGQVVAFLLGLAVWCWQWRRKRPNTFILTVALALVIASVCSLLIAWRALHDLLIVGFPVVLLAVIARLVWKYWPRRQPPTDGGTPPAPQTSTPPQVMPGTKLPPPIAVPVILLLGWSLMTSPAASVNPPAETGNVSILTANYSGAVNDRVAQVDATLQLSAAKPGQTVALFGEDVAVEEFSTKSADVKLIRDGKNVAVRLGKRGDATVQFKLLVKLGGDVTKRRLEFGIPPALASRVSLSLNQPDADVDFPTAISFQRATAGERTRVDAVIGAGDRVELLWTPRVKRAAETAATVFCQNTALVTFGSGAVNVRATLDFQVAQGELRQVRVKLPAGQRLLRVEGDAIRTWEIKDDAGAAMLAVDLLKGISGGYRLTVETEKILDALPASVTVETPHAPDVKRETGLVALRGAEELSLTVESSADLQRVDAEEFARASAQKTGGLASVFRFLKPEFALTVRVEAVRPQIEAVVRNNIRVGPEQVGVSAVIDYTIKRTGVFTLQAALPDGYRVDAVTGGCVAQWNERADGARRVLDVTLKERTLGGCSLRVELSRSHKELPKTLAVEGVHPLGAEKITGFVSVTADPGVAVKAGNFDGLTEVPVVSLPDYNALAGASGVLAYKFIAAEAGGEANWKLSVTTETVESWLRAEVVNTFTLTETLVSGRALVRYDIANAPVKELRLKIPAAFRNVEISGANIRRWEKVDSSKLMVDSPKQSTNNNQLSTGQEWRVELQSKTRGFYTLTVTWEQPRAKTNAVELTGVSAANVERETGLLAIVAKPPLQIAERAAKDLSRVDAHDFPDWAGRADDATVLAYRYLRPGYALAVDATRFAEAEVLQALVDSAQFTTVVADDGQTMTEMTLGLRNNGRQFLEVELPAGTTVWSAFVAGEPVRPSLRDGKLLLPLAQSGGGDDTVSVALTCVGTNAFPRTRGAVEFVSPKFDVPLKNARWELFLPPDYDYSQFAGTMAREVVEARPLVSSFSLGDYSLMESRSRAVATEQVRSDVSKAKAELSSGNAQQAYFSFNRALNNEAAQKDYAGEVQELKKSLKSVQASNLIVAQNSFAFANGGQVGNAPAQQQFADSFAAGEQWERLAQAQEIAAAKIRPLHVNLPTRGLRYGFTQVLQTEVNKPMTVRLLAASTKTVNWPRRVAEVLGGFVFLWVIVGATTRASRRQF